MAAEVVAVLTQGRSVVAVAVAVVSRGHPVAFPEPRSRVRLGQCHGHRSEVPRRSIVRARQFRDQTPELGVGHDPQFSRELVLTSELDRDCRVLHATVLDQRLCPRLALPRGLDQEWAFDLGQRRFLRLDR